MIYLTDIKIKNQMIYITYSNKHTKIIYFNQNNKEQLLITLEKLNIQYQKDKRKNFLYSLYIILFNIISIIVLNYTLLLNNILVSLICNSFILLSSIYNNLNFYNFIKKQLIFKKNLLPILINQKIPNEISNIYHLDSYKEIKKLKTTPISYQINDLIFKEDSKSIDNYSLSEDKGKILQFKRK